MTLRRLILTTKPDGHELRELYRSTDGPGPNTKARRREVEQLVRTGLEQALEALKEGPVEMVGTAGFDAREDVLSLDTPWKEGHPMEGKPSPFLLGRSNNDQATGGT